MPLDPGYGQTPILPHVVDALAAPITRAERRGGVSQLSRKGARCVSAPAELAATLQQVDEHEYVRFTAHWMTRASDLDTAAELTGNAVIDAMVAAAAAWVGYQQTGAEPEWTHSAGRALKDRIWHPGAPGMLPYSIVHSPGSFIVRGIAVAREALVCV